jgi:superfamily II DNA/RNA helicase
LWDQQHKALKKGADMIIATPGRLISFLNTGNFDFSGLHHLVLDEADRMLDMGFFDDIMRIVSMMPKQRQTLLFSATMPPRIRQLAAVILQNPAEVTLSVAKPAEKIDQRVCKLYDQHKEPLLLEILNDPQYNSILVFCSTKDKVKELGHLLRKRHLPARPFHSDLEQTEREEIMRDFKSGKLRILVGTDVLSRGIDVDGIDLVVNFDAPPDAEDYVHRIGRTARAERSGTAITFINPKDGRRLDAIERLIERSIPLMELPKQLGDAGDWVAESGGSGKRMGGQRKGGGGRPGGGGGGRRPGGGGGRPGGGGGRPGGGGKRH